MVLIFQKNVCSAIGSRSHSYHVGLLSIKALDSGTLNSRRWCISQPCLFIFDNQLFNFVHRSSCPESRLLLLAVSAKLISRPRQPAPAKPASIPISPSRNQNERHNSKRAPSCARSLWKN